MKRAFVFLLLAPTLVAVATWPYVAPAGGCDLILVAGLCLLTFLVSAITAPVDGYLARALPIPLRAPLIAIVGAALAVGTVCVLVSAVLRHWTMLPQWILIPFAIGAALCTGVCSLLSNDCRGPRSLSRQPHVTAQ